MGPPAHLTRLRARRLRLARAAAGTALVLTTLTGGVACGGDDDGRPTDDGTSTTAPRTPGSPLTAADTERMTQVLFRNFQTGGAQVSISTEHSPGTSVALVGEIDFAGHRGALTVTTTGPDGRSTTEELRYEEDAVYDGVTPEVAARLAATGRTGIAWVRRSPAPDQRPIDQVIGLLVSLASPRPENPQVLAQQDLTYDRTEEVAGQPADVFTTGADASYWLSAADDRLVRFQGTLTGFSGPVVIDLTEPGPRTIERPTDEAVIDQTEVPPG